MRYPFLATIAAAGILWACQPPCTPRSVAPMSNTVQRYQFSPRIIDFNVEIGDCEPGHLPVPKARVVGPTGQTGSATVQIDQREADLRAGKFPRLAVGAIQAHPVEPGPSRIELDFGTMSYEIGVDFVAVLDPPRNPRLPVFCRPPLRIEGETVVCTYDDAFGSPPRVVEINDAGVTSLGDGSRLWASPPGYVITVDGGIGWLRAGQHLSEWQPEATLRGEALGLSATDDAVVVLHETSLERRRSANLSDVILQAPRPNRAIGLQLIGSTDESILVSGWATTDGGLETYTTEAFALGDGGLASLGVVEGLKEQVLTAFGPVYWTSDVNSTWLRAYVVSGPPMMNPLFEVRALGSCAGGIRDKPGCEAGGFLGPFGLEGAFLQCPFVDDGGVRFVSIELYGTEIGDCEGNYAYVGNFGVPPDPDGYLDVIDLSPFVATAPYR